MCLWLKIIDVIRTPSHWRPKLRWLTPHRCHTSPTIAWQSQVPRVGADKSQALPAITFADHPKSWRTHGYTWPFFILPNKDDQVIWIYLNLVKHAQKLSYHVFSMNCQGFASIHSRFLPWKRIAQINQITTILTHSCPNGFGRQWDNGPPKSPFRQWQVGCLLESTCWTLENGFRNV